MTTTVSGVSRDVRTGADAREEAYQSWYIFFLSQQNNITRLCWSFLRLISRLMLFYCKKKILCYD
jgi:hypothetical protein